MQENFKVELEKLAEMELELNERRAALRGQALEQVQKLITEFDIAASELGFAEEAAPRPLSAQVVRCLSSTWTRTATSGRVVVARRVGSPNMKKMAVAVTIS